MRTLRRLVPLFVVNLMAACGGGGGGGGSDNTSVPNNGNNATANTPVTVSSSNYAVVANEATAASAETAGLSDLGQIVGADTQVLGGWAFWGLQRFSAVQAQPVPAATVAGALQSQVLACGSGTVTVAPHDVDNNNVLSGGDWMTLDFANCTVDGDTINGRVTITLNATPTGVAINDSVRSVDLTMAFENVSEVSSSVTSTANGSLRLVSQRNGLNLGQDTVSASLFTASSSVGGAQRQRTLTGFTSTLQYASTELTVSFSGTVASSVLNGQSITVSTPTAFRQRNADAYPYVGALKAVGANGSAATLVTIDATQVTVSLDANGDGTPEQSSQVAWSTIL